jgi:hypothetical protein
MNSKFTPRTRPADRIVVRQTPVDCKINNIAADLSPASAISEYRATARIGPRGQFRARYAIAFRASEFSHKNSLNNSRQAKPPVAGKLLFRSAMVFPAHVTLRYNSNRYNSNRLLNSTWFLALECC